MSGGRRPAFLSRPTLQAHASACVGLLLLAILAACGVGSPAVQSPTPPPGDDGPAAQLSRWLPADTGWMVWVPDVERLSSGWLSEGSSVRARVQLASLQWLGDDVLSAEARAASGLLPHGCAGAAAIGPHGRTTVLFACLSDPMRFTREAMRRWKQHDDQLATELLDGGWTLLSGAESGPALLVGPSFAIGVLGSYEMDAAAQARQLVAGDPADSLGATSAYADLRRQVAEDDVWGYVDLGGLVRGALGLAPELTGRTTADATACLERQWRARLARARAEGASDELLVALDESFRARRRAIRDDAEARLARAWVGEVGPVGISIDVRPNGFAARALWQMSSAAELTHLIRSAAPALGDRIVLPRRPSLLFEARLDADRMGLLFDRALSFVPTRSEPQAATELVRKLRSAWDGAVDLVWLAPESDAKEPSAQLAVVLGLRDPSAAREALGVFLGPSSGGTGRKTGSDAGAYPVELPGLPRLEASVVDDRLVVANRPELVAGRAGGPSSTPPWHGTGHRVVRTMLASPGASLVAALDLGELGAMLEAQFVAGESVAMQPPSPPAGDSDAGAAAPPVGATPDAARLERTIERLSRRVDAIDRHLDGLSSSMSLALARRSGLVALRLEPTAAGWGLDATWVAGTLSAGEVLEAWLVRVLGPETAPGSDLGSLWQERDRLDAERLRLEGQRPTPTQRADGSPWPGTSQSTDGAARRPTEPARAP